jgi:Toprim domain
MGSIATFGQNATPSLAAIASYCGRADHAGNQWKCNCPICGRHSLSITYGNKFPILIKCWHCEATGENDGYTEQREYLVDKGLLDPSFKKLKFDRAALERHNAARRAEAEAIWTHRMREPVTADRGSGRYLEGRGLDHFIGHPALQSVGGDLLARVWNVRHGLSAVQFTYINWMDGSYTRDRSQDRRTVGVMKGGGVWLGSPVRDEWCVVGEGLETVMSAMLLFDVRVGVAVLGPNIKSLELPRQANRLWIAADNDETGVPAAMHAAKYWRLHRGCTVKVSVPDKKGADFNDVLKEVM